MRSLVALAALCSVAAAQPAPTQREAAPATDAAAPTQHEPAAPTEREPAPRQREAAIAIQRDAAPPAKPRKPGAQLRLAGIMIGGTGVVALATGTLFAVSARKRADDISDAPVWDQARYDGGAMAARNAKIMFGIGAASVVGGVVMYIVGHKRANEAAHVSVTPTRGGATLVWSCEL
jgi:hypothetical protein